MSKKRWSKPVLTVLCRTNKEENVLCACKWNRDLDGPGQNKKCFNNGGKACDNVAPS